MVGMFGAAGLSQRMTFARAYLRMSTINHQAACTRQVVAFDNSNDPDCQAFYGR